MAFVSNAVARIAGRSKPVQDATKPSEVKPIEAVRAPTLLDNTEQNLRRRGSRGSTIMTSSRGLTGAANVQRAGLYNRLGG